MSDVLFEQIGILDRLISAVPSHSENRRNKGAKKSRSKAKAVERIHERVKLQKLAKGKLGLIGNGSGGWTGRSKVLRTGTTSGMTVRCYIDLQTTGTAE